MPYIKQDPPWARMGRLLRGYGLNAARLAAVLGCSTPTALTRIREPERLTLGDIVKINERAHIPMEELRAAISK